MQSSSRISLKTTAQQSPDAVRYIRRQSSPVGLALQNGTERFGSGDAAKRPLGGQHLIEQAPERPDIGTLVYAFAARLLGTHVRRSSSNDAYLYWSSGFALIRTDLFGQSEVENL